MYCLILSQILSLLPKPRASSSHRERLKSNTCFYQFAHFFGDYLCQGCYFNLDGFEECILLPFGYGIFYFKRSQIPLQQPYLQIALFSSNIGNWTNLILLHSAQMWVKKEAFAILLVVQMLLAHLSHSLTSPYK